MQIFEKIIFRKTSKKTSCIVEKKNDQKLYFQNKIVNQLIQYYKHKTQKIVSKIENKNHIICIESTKQQTQSIQKENFHFISIVRFNANLFFLSNRFSITYNVVF